MHETDTPWKFNIASEDKPSEKDSKLPTIIFQGLSLAVKLRGSIFFELENHLKIGISAGFMH